MDDGADLVSAMIFLALDRMDEWKPGDKTVYVKFDKYKPRAEPSSGAAVTGDRARLEGARGTNSGKRK